MTEPKPVWFARRRYGWGWGLPTCWQGWAVLGVYLLAVISDCVLLAVTGSEILFQVLLIAATAILLAVCLFKGGPPRWHWGED
jgi:hypothetical protein